MVEKGLAAILEEINPMIVNNFNSPHQVDLKPDESIVTKTDRQVEEVLIPKLKELLPDSEVVGEESASLESKSSDHYFESDYLWAVDPIDGTVNFTAGLPLFTVSVGLFKRSDEGYKAVSGAISFPVFDELYYTLNGKTKLKNIRTGSENAITRNDSPPITSLLIPNLYVIGKNVDMKNPFATNIRLLGSTAVDMLYVNLGKAAATVTLAHIWDIAGALAIAETQGLYPRVLTTGEIKKWFTKDDFMYGDPKRHWRLKNPLVLCKEEYFSDVKDLITN